MELWQQKTNHNLTVEAVRLDESNIDAAAIWCGADVVEEIDPEHPDEMQKGLNIDTFVGTKRASLGMYVAKGGKSFFVMWNRPFEEIYEPVDREAPPLESAGDSRKARGFADPFDLGRMGP